MKLKVTMTDKDNLVIKLNKWPMEFYDSILQELLVIGNDIRNYIIQSMKNSPADFSKPTMGKRKTGEPHYPSFRGNPPRIDTGRLVGSINVEKLKNGVGVGSISKGKYIVNYAKDLESMEELDRPFIKPAYEKFAPTIENRLVNAITERARR